MNLQHRIRAHSEKRDRDSLVRGLRLPAAFRTRARLEHADRAQLQFEIMLQARAEERDRFLTHQHFAPVIETLGDQRNAVKRIAELINWLAWVETMRGAMKATGADEALGLTLVDGRRKRVPVPAFNLPGFRIGKNAPRRSSHVWASGFRHKDLGKAGGGRLGSSQVQNSRWRALLVVNLDRRLPEDLGDADRMKVIAQLLQLTGDKAIERRHVRSILVQRKRAGGKRRLRNTGTRWVTPILK